MRPLIQSRQNRRVRKETEAPTLRPAQWRIRIDLLVREGISISLLNSMSVTGRKSPLRSVSLGVDYIGERHLPAFGHVLEEKKSGFSPDDDVEVAVLVDVNHADL